MSDLIKPDCPECDDGVDRRGFLRTVAVQAASLAAVSAVPALPRLAADTPAPARAAKPPRPAEGLIRELYTTLTPEQRRALVLPFDHGAGPNPAPTRKGTYNAPIQGKRIGDHYTRPQQELVQRIVRSMTSGDEGYNRISRNGQFDSSGSFEGNGAMIFGDPSEGQQFAFVFAGHHLTLRCDGDTEANMAFGGPIYYGHSADGNSPRNVHYYQTQAVKNLFEALNANQRRAAVLPASPGEGVASVRFRDGQRPGLAAGDLTPDQRRLVEFVMREVLSPYRREDADEVMDLVRRSGGLERIHLGFYRERASTDETDWTFWRLEGPGFVWNYRVLPHVHTFVNVGLRS